MCQFYRLEKDILRRLAARRVRVEQVAIAVESAQHQSATFYGGHKGGARLLAFQQFIQVAMRSR